MISRLFFALSLTMLAGAVYASEQRPSVDLSLLDKLSPVISVHEKISQDLRTEALKKAMAEQLKKNKKKKTVYKKTKIKTHILALKVTKKLVVTPKNIKDEPKSIANNIKSLPVNINMDNALQQLQLSLKKMKVENTELVQDVSKAYSLCTRTPSKPNK